MRRFLHISPLSRPWSRLPSLGGSLAIYNGLLWIGLILFFRGTRFSRSRPQWLIDATAVVLGFPLVTLGSLTDIVKPGRFLDEGGVVFVSVILGINSLLWGYGLAGILSLIGWTRRFSSDEETTSDLNALNTDRLGPPTAEAAEIDTTSVVETSSLEPPSRLPLD